LPLHNRIGEQESECIGNAPYYRVVRNENIDIINLILPLLKESGEQGTKNIGLALYKAVRNGNIDIINLFLALLKESG
jgi:hypothetical protein